MSARLNPVIERTPADRFENAIREVGVIAACEWFGHRADSDFTKETQRLLAERSAAAAECTCAATDMPFGRCCKATGNAE